MLSCEEREAGNRVEHVSIMYNEPVGHTIVNGREERIPSQVKELLYHPAGDLIMKQRLLRLEMKEGLISRNNQCLCGARSNSKAFGTGRVIPASKLRFSVGLNLL